MRRSVRFNRGFGWRTVRLRRGLTGAVIRDRRTAAGLSTDEQTVSTRAGERIGVGDRVTTRRNDREPDVANRETWTVTCVHRDHSLSVTGRAGHRRLPAEYVDSNLELGYASTIHGAQGETVTAAHLLELQDAPARPIGLGPVEVRCGSAAGKHEVVELRA